MPLLRTLGEQAVHEVTPETLLTVLEKGDALRAGAPPPRLVDGHVVDIENEQIRIDPLEIPGTLLIDPKNVTACIIAGPFQEDAG